MTFWLQPERLVGVGQGKSAEAFKTSETAYLKHRKLKCFRINREVPHGWSRESKGQGDMREWGKVGRDQNMLDLPLSKGNDPHHLPLRTLGSFPFNTLPHPSAHASGPLQVLDLGYKSEVTPTRHQVLSAAKMTNERKPNLLGLLPMFLGLLPPAPSHPLMPLISDPTYTPNAPQLSVGIS